uniref:Uncharacterized protein n=1 Tax=Rhizophora mucronata TaxID=61149 RepID=A0A2P2QGS5_RHIMU
MKAQVMQMNFFAE